MSDRVHRPFGSDAACSPQAAYAAPPILLAQTRPADGDKVATDGATAGGTPDGDGRPPSAVAPVAPA